MTYDAHELDSRDFHNRYPNCTPSGHPETVPVRDDDREALKFWAIINTEYPF